MFVLNSSAYEFTDRQWREGTASIVSKLRASTKAIVLVPGTPGLSFDGPSCLRDPYGFSKRLPDSNRWCEEPLSSAASEAVARLMTEVAARFPEVYVLNLNELVCPGKRCAAMAADGIAVYSDSAHLTSSFVSSKVPEMENMLNVMGLGPESLGQME